MKKVVHVEINWHDQESSSEKSFRAVYTSNTSSRVMKCGGHVDRAHEKALKQLKSKKEFDSGYISRHGQFPRGGVSCVHLQRKETFCELWVF